MIKNETDTSRRKANISRRRGINNRRSRNAVVAEKVRGEAMSAAAVGLIVEGVRGWFTHRSKMKEAEKTLELKEVEVGIRGGDRNVKTLCFVVLFMPLVIGWWDIELVKNYFTGIEEACPKYYLEMIYGICASIWGGSIIRQIAGRVKS